MSTTSEPVPDSKVGLPFFFKAGLNYHRLTGNLTSRTGTYIAPGANAPAYARAGDCAPWNDYTTWSADTKAGLQKVAMGHMDALQNSL